MSRAVESRCTAAGPVDPARNTSRPAHGPSGASAAFFISLSASYMSVLTAVSSTAGTAGVTPPRHHALDEGHTRSRVRRGRRARRMVLRLLPDAAGASRRPRCGVHMVAAGGELGSLRVWAPRPDDRAVRAPRRVACPFGMGVGDDRPRSASVGRRHRRCGEPGAGVLAVQLAEGRDAGGRVPSPSGGAR